MRKRRDFACITQYEVTGFTPPNGAALAVDLSAAVPLTAIEAHLSFHIVTSGPYSFSLGPEAGTSLTDRYPFYYAWPAGAIGDTHVGGLKMPLRGNASSAQIYTVSDALFANLTDLDLHIHGYWEDPLRPYHYDI